MTDDRRQLLAVMFTDIQGFSAMTAEDEERTVRVVREHREIVRAALAEHGGREMRTVGDAFLVLFESAVSAVRCGIAIQERMAARNATAAERDHVWVRIGIHAGEVVVGHEGELYGETVNLAARVEPHAPPGGISVTDVVHAQVRSHVDRRFEPLGTVPLKGVDAPPALFRLAIGRPAPPIAPPPTRSRRSWLPAAALFAVAAVGFAWGFVTSGPATLKVSEDPEAQRLYGEAMRAMETGDLDIAQQRLRSAYERDPDAWRLQLSRALSSHDSTAGLDLFDRAASSAPPGPEGDLARLVQRAIRAGDDVDVAKAWDTWGEAHPEDVEGQLVRALLYPAHGKDGLASHEGGPHDHGPTIELRKFVQAHPDHLTGRLQLSQHEQNDNHRDAARVVLLEGLERCGGCAIAHAQLGVLALAAHDHDEAERELRAAAEIDPTMRGLREAMAALALARGDEAERVRRVDAILAETEQPAEIRAQFAIGHASELMVRGRFRDARALLERALPLADPALRADALAGWASIEAEHGHRDHARDLLRRLGEALADPATPSTPRDALLVRSLAIEQAIATQERDLAKVEGIDQRLRELPRERFVSVDPQAYLDQSARQLAALRGDADTALALADKGAPGCPRDVLDAELLEVAGAPDRALAAWERAVGSEVPCEGLPRVKAWVSVGEAALARGDRARAAEAAAAARERWPDADPELPWAVRLAALETATASSIATP